VIPLPNDVLLQESAESETVLDSFARADEWVGRGVKSIWSMLFKTGLINIDFSTLRQAFQQRGGKTLFGLGEGSGENSVADAIASLKLCPLLHTPEFSRKADRLLVNIVGGTDLTLPKVNEIMSAIAGAANGGVAHQSVGTFAPTIASSGQEPAQSVSPGAPPAASKAAASAKAQQDEFGFGELESRGYFEKTDRNLFDGQDLDVPTYLRKGIKIVL
jgi:cell division protein FtsZ